MSTFRDGRTAGETLQVVALAGYVFGSLANAAAYLLGRGLSFILCGLLTRTDNSFLEDQDSTHIRSANNRVNELSQYVDSHMKTALFDLNSSYDDVHKARSSVPTRLWNAFYKDLYLNSFNEVKAFREWNSCARRAGTLYTTPTQLRTGASIINRPWIVLATAKADELIANLVVQYKTINYQATNLGQDLQPFRVAADALYERLHTNLVDLQDRLEGEILNNSSMRSGS